MQEKDFDRLVKRYLAGKATPLETELVEAHLRLMEEMNESELSRETLDRHRAEVWERLQEEPYAGKVRVMTRFRWVAAAIVLFAVVTTFLLLNKKESTPAVIAKADVQAPASNRATIQLGNGQTVYLDSANNGQLAYESGVKVVKLADGRIVYSGNTNETVYNTLTNPKGSRAIDIGLSDGSHVWLNAGSSVTYPVAFAVGKERRVTMSGEAYYEIAHRDEFGFTVQKGNTEVKVLGTHFNVKAYDNDADIKVTLLEGKVKVKIENKEQLLAPGEQAIVDNGAIQLAKDPNLDDVIAWKNGFTSFHGADMKVILRELERWYDITTEMKGEIKANRVIDVPRSVPLSDVLKSLLDDNGIKYEYDAATKKLTVLP